MIGETDSLHPAFRLTVERILAGMRQRGWDPVIGSGMRTHAQQDALFAQGRADLDQVNALRRSAGLSPISAAANARPVTKARAGQSNHNLTTALLPDRRNSVSVVHGYAVDIVDRALGWEIPHRKFWQDLGSLAKEYGCTWGGDWTPPDVAHVEMKIVDGPPQRTMIA